MSNEKLEEAKCFDCKGVIKYGICFCNREEPKQETLEEFALRNSKYTNHSNINYQKQEAIILGAKWQAERMYSESDKIMKFLDTEIKLGLSDIKTIERIKWYFETYFEQFKKK